MSDLSRRNLVRLAAGLAVGAGVVTPAMTSADEFGQLLNFGDGVVEDKQLESVIKNPSHYMFGEQAVVKLEGDRHSRDLIITSARDVSNQSSKVYVRSGTMRIFRANPDVDDFTKQGGFYYTFNGKQGQVQFKHPGQIVMVVRDHNDNAWFYTMVFDLRC